VSDVTSQVPKEQGQKSKINLEVLTLSNIGKEPAFAVKFEDVLHEGFQFSDRKLALSKDNSLSVQVKIEPGSSKYFAFSARSNSIGQFVWNPCLVYMDGKRNYKITKPQTGMVVIEPLEFVDIAHLQSKKEKIELQLKRLDSNIQSGSEIFYSLREEFSKIDETIARSKNEYEKLNSQLEQVRTDLETIDSMQNDVQNTTEKKKLQNEEMILKERLERRRSIFQQTSQ
jgi:hypothetical protein